MADVKTELARKDRALALIFGTGVHGASRVPPVFRVERGRGQGDDLSNLIHSLLVVRACVKSLTHLFLPCFVSFFLSLDLSDEIDRRIAIEEGELDVIEEHLSLAARVGAHRALLSQKRDAKGGGGNRCADLEPGVSCNTVLWPGCCCCVVVG